MEIRRKHLRLIWSNNTMLIPKNEDVVFVALLECDPRHAKTVRCVSRKQFETVVRRDTSSLQPMLLSTGWSRVPFIWALAFDWTKSNLPRLFPNDDISEHQRRR